MSLSSNGAPPSLNPWQRLIGSDSRRLTIEAVAAVFLAGEVLVLLCFASAFHPFVLTCLWAQWVLTVVLLRVGGLFKVFGPVMMYDLLRASRRKRYLFLRILYLFSASMPGVVRNLAIRKSNAPELDLEFVVPATYAGFTGERLEGRLQQLGRLTGLKLAFVLE